MITEQMRKQIIEEGIAFHKSKNKHIADDNYFHTLETNQTIQAYYEGASKYAAELEEKHRAYCIAHDLATSNGAKAQAYAATVKELEDRLRIKAGNGEPVYNHTEVMALAAAGESISNECDTLQKRVEILEEALNKVTVHCLCNRGTGGFDYNEPHKILGKPKPGARWNQPYDIANEALARSAELKGGGE